MLGAGFFALFISGFLSAPFTFIFAMPAYVVIGAVLVMTRRPSGIEWAWKMALLGSCLIFVFTSDLIDYFLGTVVTVGRTPSVPSVGQASIHRRVAASISGSLAMRPSAAAVVRERSRSVAPHRSHRWGGSRNCHPTR
jgi:hypothetical protein